MIPVILGCTGSGKTRIGIELAKQLGGEIISADSRAVYRGLDVGTAKPTREEQAAVPHYGLDLVDLNDRFTVADWKAYAEQKIYTIQLRDKIPIIVGGTGLYIDALVFNYYFHGPTGAKIHDFEQKTCADRKEMNGNFLLIGLAVPRDELRARLRQRIDQMFTPTLFAESKKIAQLAVSIQKTDPTKDNIKSDLFAKAGNIYRFADAYLNQAMSLEEAKEKAFYADYHLAKRQLTWFKRNPAIHWLPPENVIPFAIQKIVQL